MTCVTSFYNDDFFYAHLQRHQENHLVVVARQYQVDQITFCLFQQD